LNYNIEIISAPSILGLKPSGVEDLGKSLLASGLAEKQQSSSVSRDNVTLNWATTSELNNSTFEIERLIVNLKGSGQVGQWSIAGSVNGNVTSSIPQNYFFNDRVLISGKYKFRLKQIDFNGNFEYFNLTNGVDVGIPADYNLSQNYPNPFNPSTKFDYDLPKDGKVRLIVYDISGREIIKLIDEFKTADIIQFNSMQIDYQAEFIFID